MLRVDSRAGRKGTSCCMSLHSGCFRGRRDESLDVSLLLLTVLYRDDSRGLLQSLLRTASRREGTSQDERLSWGLGCWGVASRGDSYDRSSESWKGRF